MSETFGRADKPTSMEPIEGYNTWKTERCGTDKGGGGLAMLYRDGLIAHEWMPPVPPNLQYVMNERQWLLVDNMKEKCAFLHIYIACQNTRNSGFLQWNEDLFHLVTQEAIKLRKQGFIILSMGDFNTRVGTIPGMEGNTPDTNQNTPMFINFTKAVNLTIINTLPITKGLFTRFMDNSGRAGTQAVLDYGLINEEQANTVTSFVIDKEARFDCGSDHALLECIIEFGSSAKIKWSFQEMIQYHLHDNSDYKEYQANLDLEASLIPLNTFSDLPADQMLPHITDSITKSAKKTFGLKVKSKKRGRKLPRSIIAQIKTKNALARSLHHADSRSYPHETDKMMLDLEKMKNDIKNYFSNFKLKRRYRLRANLLNEDPSRKKFWRFLKNQIKSAGSITAVYDATGKMVFNQDEIEEAVLNHFGNIFRGKRIPVFLTNIPAPSQIDLTLTEIDQILGQTPPSVTPKQFENKVCSPYSFLELNDILNKLPSGKASGYDRYSVESKLFLRAMTNLFPLNSS